MSHTLASDMAQRSLDALLERMERQNDFSADEARELLSGCAIQLSVLDRLWEQIQHCLDRGIEARRLRGLLTERASDLEMGIKALQTAVAKLKTARLPSEEKAEDAAMLERALQRTVDRRGVLLTLLNNLETPFRHLDFAMLPSGRQDPSAAGYIGLDELKTHLLSPKKT
jgi:hypothetical protein